MKQVSKSQSPSQQAYLQNRYARDMLYSTTQPYRATEDLELSIDKGLVVGVIKKHDPLGSARRWFVDDGSKYDQNFKNETILHFESVFT